MSESICSLAPWVCQEMLPTHARIHTIPSEGVGVPDSVLLKNINVSHRVPCGPPLDAIGPKVSNCFMRGPHQLLNALPSGSTHATHLKSGISNTLRMNSVFLKSLRIRMINKA